MLLRLKIAAVILSSTALVACTNYSQGPGAGVQPYPAPYYGTSPYYDGYYRPYRPVHGNRPNRPNRPQYGYKDLPPRPVPDSFRPPQQGYKNPPPRPRPTPVRPQPR